MSLLNRYLIYITLLVGCPIALAQDNNWPQQVDSEKGSIIIYQPQVERFDGNRLEARAAIALKLKSESDTPMFGAIWISARVDTNRDTRTYTIRQLKISDVRIADGKEGDKQKLNDFLQERLSESDFTLSLDELLSSLDVDKNSLVQNGLKHNPPNIILSNEPAVLVPFDGEPILQEIKNSNLQQVVNTPFLVAKSAATFYLYGGGDLWYSSKSALGPWQVSKSTPKEIMQLTKDKKERKSVRQSEDQPVPKIIVSTSPTELIVSAGEPNWSPVAGMDLLYMDNTDRDVFLELSTQHYYTLMSGRWYQTTALGERWQHVANDQLPKAFADINPDSVNGHVLSQVAGTQQAREAILDNTIPQTSAIRRDDSAVSVEYDGNPTFVDIEKIRVQYAVNTESAVFRVNSHYYLAEQGVWYESSSATGPWVVATSVPQAIYDIPPSNPHYNVTYVHIYDVMPDVVYVGYTPGYMHSYYYHGTVVYGTGWYYSPWYHRVYYPRPWTWGLRVTYSPWVGWSYGLGWSSGPFYFYFGPRPHPYYHRHYAWFGPGGYRPYYRPYVKKGYRKHVHYRNKNRHKPHKVAIRPNIYYFTKNVNRNVKRPHNRKNFQPRPAKNRKNNVFTDRQGNVFRRDRTGQWQQRNKGKWDPAKNLDNPRFPKRHKTPSPTRLRPIDKHDRRKAKPGTRRQQNSISPAQPRPHATRPQLERDYSKRQKGAHRTRQFQKQWKSQSPPKGPGRQQHHRGKGTKNQSHRGDNRHAR